MPTRPGIILTVLLCAASASAETAPRNIFLLIADGCGFNHVLVADYWEHGRAGSQVYESFPVRLAMATPPYGQVYDPEAFWRDGPWTDDRTTDSAAAVTALTTGRKTLNRRLAVGPEGEAFPTLVEAMEAGGRATGVVSSVNYSHATPAGTVVRNDRRYHYEEIARDMVFASAVDVIMGPGHPEFERDGRAAKKTYFKFVGGEETWRTLRAGSAGGDADGDLWPDPWVLIESVEQFRDLMSGPTPPRVIGVPWVRETLQQERWGEKMAGPGVVPFLTTVPSLREMSLGAVNVLDEHPGGFFVMIEGGAVDWAGHDNQLGRMIEEMAAFNRTVEAIVGWIEANGGWQANLLIITADHETGYLTGPIPEVGEAARCRFKHPVASRGAGEQPDARWNSDDHTNALVPLYAKGPGSELLAARAGAVDPVYGPYLDNTDVGAVLQRLAAHR